MRSSAFAVFAVLAGGACASAPKTEPVTEATATQQSAATRNRDVIGRDELTKPSVVNMTVLDAVRALRPHFLTVRGQNTMPAKSGNDPNGAPMSDNESGKVHASIDGNKIVPIEELAAIRAGSVAEVRFLSVAAAMQKFGGTARQGPVILVKTM